MITFEQGLSITGVAPFLGIVDAAQSVCQGVHPHHGGSGDLLSLVEGN